jgi:hypothetical protein
MGLSKEVDISSALDTAETREVSGDPIMCKLRITLQDGKEKYCSNMMVPRRRQYRCSQRSRASENAWRKYPQSTVRHGTEK